MKCVVYCSSKDTVSQGSKDDATAVGQWIGRHGGQLVYGGIGLGLMRIVATEASLTGAKVLGVVPGTKRLMAFETNDDDIYTIGLNNRKQQMIALGDVFVALAGGYGTLDEIMATLASLTFDGDDDNRLLIIVNRDGLYDNLLAQFDVMVDRGLLEPSVLSRVRVVEDGVACCSLLDELFVEK